MSAPLNLTIRHFAQIREISLDLADLTVLVGVQGAGKSIALQWLKAALDGKHVMNALRDAGEHAEGPKEIIDLVFGDGMGSAWTDNSTVTLGEKAVTPEGLRRRGGAAESAFFVPAHRSMLIQDGWAAPFQKLSSDTPVVARMFSQNLFDRFSAGRGGKLFPLDRLLKREYRELVDRAVYHGGSIGLEQEAKHAKRLKMSHGGAQLPFMTWTAGQREFTPLLLGLYHVLTSRTKRKREAIDWVIVEEPEMGLHPHAITVFLLLVLDLLWRGYRVVLSTHSPHVLTAMWMMQRLIRHRAHWSLLCRAFEVDRSKAIEGVFKSALTKHYAVHALSFGADDKVTSQDISNLDPDSDNPFEADWGGLTGFSSRFGDAVREAVIASGE